MLWKRQLAIFGLAFVLVLRRGIALAAVGARGAPDPPPAATGAACRRSSAAIGLGPGTDRLLARAPPRPFGRAANPNGRAPD